MTKITLKLTEVSSAPLQPEQSENENTIMEDRGSAGDDELVDEEPSKRLGISIKITKKDANSDEESK